MATKSDSTEKMSMEFASLDVRTDKRLKRDTNKDFLLKDHGNLLSELKKIGCSFTPSMIFLPTFAVNPVLQDSDRSNLVDISTLTKSIDKTLEGKYLLCRTISMPAEIMSDVVVIVDDPEGILAVRLFIESFYPELLPVGTIMVIKEPSFETSQKYDGYTLRCKSTGNVAYLNQYQCQQFFPDVTWEGEIPKENRAVDEKLNPENAEDWKVLGNKYFAEKKYYSSINAYTTGLTLDALNVALLSNRSAAYIQISAFNWALNDANEVLNIDPHHVKSNYRKAKALCGLKKYEEAFEILVGMESLELQESDGNEIMNLKSKMELFLYQQKTGDYDVAFMVKTAKANNSCHLDYADYNGPVEVRSAPGKGRGLFVTQDVKPEQLIIGSKAFAMHPSGSVVLYCDLTGVNKQNMKSMELAIARKLMTNPEIGKEFYHLYAGPELKFLDKDQLGNNTCFVDRNRIANVCGVNYFSCDSRTDIQSSSGLWLLPSYINHSCFDCNCNWIMFGNFMLIRALKPIAKDEEVLISYVDPDQYSSRKDMFENDRFLCNCRLCEIDRKDSKEVHEKRGCIIEACEKLDASSGSVVFQRFVDEMASLRPEKPELNIYMDVPMSKLIRSLLNEGQDLRAASVIENQYNITKQTAIIDASLAASASLALLYLRRHRKGKAKKWFQALKECALLTYGTASVGLFEAKYPQQLDPLFEAFGKTP